MNYRKIVIFLTFILGAAAFCKAGILPGKSADTAGQKVYAAPDKKETKESEKIAVVNLDEGVARNGKRINYGEELSRFPSLDFEYSSLEAARTGIETGRFGAYVIIPTAFSQNVESINTTPQVSQLEYAVNRSYSGERQYELLYNVWSYVDSLNNNLSYMYVDNILREFHDAQDGAERIMENDLEDLAAMEGIRAQELVTLAGAPQMPAEETMPESLDVSGFAERSSMLAEALNAEYESNVQDIQTQITSLNAGASALAEQITGLAAKAAELDLTVDANGESIVEKAGDRLRSELKRQAELTLDKEMVSGYLRKLKHNSEEIIKIYDLYKGEEQPESADRLISLVKEQMQELDVLLEKAGQAEDLDIDRIAELAKSEYADPIVSNADEAKKASKQRYEEELAAVTAYQGQLADFHPQTDSLFLVQNIQELKENHRGLQAALLENNQAYLEYVQKTTEASKDYADNLQKYAEADRKAYEEALAEGLNAWQGTKEKNSAVNQRILRDFSSKLSYTRLGSAKHIRVYQFIANPLCAKDRSVKQTVAGYLSGCGADGAY